MRGLAAFCLWLLAASTLAAQEPAGAAPDRAADESSATAEEQPPPLQRRHYEDLAHENPYAITPHRPNFLLPISYTHRPDGRGLDAQPEDLDQIEVKFQLSFKVAVWRDPLSLPADLYFAYTGRSFWQAYNSQLSSPFRDTNHEPEVFLVSRGDWTLGAWRDLNLRVGLNHQSNGQSLPRSRSWNRVYLGLSGRWGRFFVDALLWQRIQEQAKTGPDDPEGDDNPDIERTVGQGRLSLAWVIGNKTINLDWRNNLRRDNRGALTAAFTYPLTPKLRGYVEAFTGYGETLIDYNHSNERLSLGIALSGWP